MDHKLVSVEKVPDEYRSVFSDFPYFNKIQSAVFDKVLNSDEPFVIAAPTGSGKTVIFELAIVRLLKQVDSFANPILPSTKIIYVAPMKALCEERYVDWYKKFNIFGLKCVSITGDSNQSFMDMMEYNIIITTPEKWDTLTRRWRDHKKLVSSIKLFLIDEIHLLNEDKRGATLETIVCRMKTIESSQYEDSSSSMLLSGIRFVAVSATIPNIEDIAKWIGSVNNEAVSYSFNEDTRPVKLNKIVYGYQTQDKNAFKFDIMLNYKLQNIIMQYAEGKPTLIFCSTRKSVEMTAKYISQNITVGMTFDQKSVLSQGAKIILDNKCKEFLIHGVGYHHAGMLIESRKIIEDLFRNGDLPILVTTSTLAMGVNLPAHLVIIKSTKCFINGEYRDYDEGSILQMIGRAGRPQFDTSATAVILTTNRDKVLYEAMVQRGQPIESNLHKHLIEHLNADICLKTVTDLSIALQWISSTFLYIRAKKSPRYYGLPINLTDKELDGKLLEMCQIDINRLNSAGMITMDQMATIFPTPLGQLMAHYYITFDTMKVFISIKGDEVLSQMLIILSKCEEFQNLYIRTSDKKSLNFLNKNKHNEYIRFPYNCRISTVEMKVNCLVQAVFGCLQIIDHSLLNDAARIIRTGQRIAICLTKYMETRSKNCFMALLNSYILAKCFQAKIWENSKYVSRQLSDIGTIRSKHLVDADKTTFQSILDSNPRDLERIMKRKAPFGDNIRDQIMSLPFYEMVLTKHSSERVIEVKITLQNAEQFGKNDDLVILLVGDDKNNVLLHEKYTHNFMKDVVSIERQINYDEDTVTVNAYFICEDKVGLDCFEIMEINPKESNSTTKTVKKSTNKAVKKAPVQKTLNNFFPVVKNKPQTAEKKNVDSPNKENIPENTSAQAAEQFNSKPLPSTSKSIDMSAFKSKRFGDRENLYNAPKEAILSKQTDEAPSNSNIHFSNASTSKASTLSKVVALDVIQMLNKRFLANAKAKPVLIAQSKPPITNAAVSQFISNFEAKSMPKLLSKRLAVMENFENSLCLDNNVAAPKRKKVDSNDGTAVGVPDSTVNSEFHYEVVTIEPEDNSLRAEKVVNSRNITWRSPLVFNPQEKHSPRMIVSNLSNRSSGERHQRSQIAKNGIHSQLSLRSNKNIPKFPITHKEIEEAQCFDSLSQDSFISPDLFRRLRDGSPKEKDVGNLSANSSKSVYEQNLASNYYNSLLSGRASSNKDVEIQSAVQVDNLEDLLEDSNDAALLEILSNVEHSDHLAQDSQKIKKFHECGQYDLDYNSPRSSSVSTKLPSPPAMDFDEIETQTIEEPQRHLGPNQSIGQSQRNFGQNQTIEEPQRHFEPHLDYNLQIPQQRAFDYDTQVPISISPPRIQFDQMVRNYYEPKQTSRYFNAPPQYSMPTQAFGSLLQKSHNQIEEPPFFNCSSQYLVPSFKPTLPKSFSSQPYQQPVRYANEHFGQQSNQFQIPYPLQQSYAGIQRFASPFNNPYLQYDERHNFAMQAMNDNQQFFRNRQCVVERPSHAFGSVQDQIYYNERPTEMLNPAYNQRFADISYPRQVNPSQLIRLPQPYHEMEYQNNSFNVQNPTYASAFNENLQNDRKVEQGSQLMDALNPPEERDGKRLVFSRFMNSLG